MPRVFEAVVRPFPNPTYRNASFGPEGVYGFGFDAVYEREEWQCVCEMKFSRREL